ncbi:P-II family nitrogen regulator [Botrimarina sp.]|uniref:P-II family nitrogen regulator n=1 Tax=Botrimarina sp. TaxID=2795802 RepID=UPI0032EB8AF6
MKLIIAVIQPTKLEAAQQALAAIGVTRLTVADAMGFARQRGHAETYRGHEYETHLLRKVELQIAVNDDFVEPTIHCLEEHARTSKEGHIGDGKVLVLPLAEAYQISDGLTGPGAV